MYTSFNRPHLEYVSEVWDPGCSLVNAQRLGEVQLSADRIVTGLPIFACKPSLYLENRLDLSMQ